MSSWWIHPLLLWNDPLYSWQYSLLWNLLLYSIVILDVFWLALTGCTLRLLLLLRLERNLTPLSRLECCDIIMVHCTLELLGWGDPFTSASWVAGTTGLHHHAQLTFKLFIEMESHHNAQTGIELVGSSNPPTSASLPEELGLQEWATKPGLNGSYTHFLPFRICCYWDRPLVESLSVF